MKHTERISARGYMCVKVVDPVSGEVLERYEHDNLIVTLGREALADLVGNPTSDRNITQVGCGENGAAPVPSDTGLTSAYVKVVDSITYPSSGKVQFGFSFGTSEANGKAIAEYALIDASGQMFARITHPVINKTSAFVLTGTWSIQF